MGLCKHSAYMYCNCVAWIFVGLLTPSVGTEVVSNSFTDFWYSNPHTESHYPLLMHKEVLSHTAT